MPRNWLARVTVAAVAISVPATAISGIMFEGTAQAATSAEVTWNRAAAAKAEKLVGIPYVYGGTSLAGFDCSGLTQWVYRHTGHGRSIARTAQDQYLQFRPISHADARPGDLVFFHETSDPGSYVYHVGVYEGGDDMVAATTSGQDVQFQSFAWAGDTVTFGTITHS